MYPIISEDKLNEQHVDHGAGQYAYEGVSLPCLKDDYAQSCDEFGDPMRGLKHRNVLEALDHQHTDGDGRENLA